MHILVIKKCMKVFVLLLVVACLFSFPGYAEPPQKIIYVSPDPLGVNAFLIMGQIGLEQTGAMYGAQTLVFESENPLTREENVRAAVNEGADIVIVLGFEFNDIIPEVAEENPEVQFLIVDQCIDPLPANVRCEVFKEYQEAFLIGAVAASLSQNNHVGTVCALDIPFMHRFTDGFAQGAKYITPDIKVSTLWVGGSNPFSDPVRAKELALAMHADGADYIFAVTAGGDFGIFEAAKEKDFSVFGVDINHCPTAPAHIVECQLKRVDVAIVESVQAIVNNAPEKVMVHGLESKGVGLVSLTSETPEKSQCRILEHPDVLEKVKDIQQKIIDGDIVIEDPMFQ